MCGPQGCSLRDRVWGGTDTRGFLPLTSVSSRVPSTRCHQQSCPASHRTDRFTTVNESICPVQQGSAHSIPERRGLDSGRPPHALREKRLGGGRDLGGELHWRVFNGWGYGKRAGSGVEAGWTPSVCSERCDTSRGWGVGVQGLPGSLWVSSGAGSLPSSGI